MVSHREVNIRIAGEAGQGVQTTGDLLVGALAAAGVHLFSVQSYMSRIRGGMNWYDIRIADRELFSGREEADLLVALTAETLAALAPTVRKDGGVILADEAGPPGGTALGFTAAAKEVAGSPLMANTVAAGAVFAVLGYDLAPLQNFLRTQFAHLGVEVVEKNLACARRGVELAASLVGSLAAPESCGAPAFVASGSEAIGLGAATSGVKFVASYPMTPSSGAFTYLAQVADEYGIVVEQAEDEIAAVNMICGATYAGVPAMTTTSGGGFALMCEGISLAGMLELPIVILLSQRPGPATGLPTRTGQEDLLFALHAGHGEFTRAVFAPGTVAQAYELTRCAFETAHRFQTPIILMTDQFLVDQQKNQTPFDTTLRPIDRCIVTDAPADYQRYQITADGISPRALPGGDALVVLDSDEHTEDGHITEDLGMRVRMVDKRLMKEQALRAVIRPPEHYGVSPAEFLLICWGSTYGPSREAVDIINAQGRKAAMLHFAQVWPLDAKSIQNQIATVGPAARLIVVEGNATGQFAALLRQSGVALQIEPLLRYDGLPFTGLGIAAEVAK